ncbi:MAG TPA: hypothetical protein VMT38_04840 [Terracidiphilus sp.]|nr:hypothetical protein [Terracidiphilus sp.]
MTAETVDQTIADYYRDFNTLNVRAILPYFHEPSLLIGPQGVIPVSNHAALEAAFGPVMEGLRAKGFGRSEFRQGYSKSLSSTAAIIGGTAVRYIQDGREMERVGVTYALHKGTTGWKFATVILHDPAGSG